jgi:hypothetical protein
VDAQKVLIAINNELLNSAGRTYLNPIVPTRQPPDYFDECKGDITPEGARCLPDELKHIWRISRSAVTAVVSAAAALGDRSENADYIYGKKQLREIK